MEKLKKIEQYITKGLVLDRSGKWKSIDRVVEEEKEYIMHLQKGEILKDDSWVNPSDIDESFVQKSDDEFFIKNINTMPKEKTVLPEENEIEYTDVQKKDQTAKDTVQSESGKKPVTPEEPEEEAVFEHEKIEDNDSVQTEQVEMKSVPQKPDESVLESQKEEDTKSEVFTGQLEDDKTEKYTIEEDQKKSETPVPESDKSEEVQSYPEKKIEPIEQSDKTQAEPEPEEKTELKIEEPEVHSDKKDIEDSLETKKPPPIPEALIKKSLETKRITLGSLGIQKTSEKKDFIEKKPDKKKSDISAIGRSKPDQFDLKTDSLDEWEKARSSKLKLIVIVSIAGIIALISGIMLVFL